MQITGVGILLHTTEDTYLFQERDHNTTKSPGMIAPFGGHIEEGEDALHCAQREISEELELMIDLKNFTPIGVFESHNQKGQHIQMYLAKEINKTPLELHEGKSIVELPLDEALNHPKVTAFTKEVLRSI